MSPTTPTRYAVYVRRTNPIAELKTELSKLCGIAPSHLHLCEVTEDELLSFYRDGQPASSIKATRGHHLVAYEAEPFEQADFLSFHVLARQRLVSGDEPLSGESSFEHFEDSFVGLPILTSFPADYTCRQIYDHFWSMAKDKLTNPNSSKDVLELRVHNGRGRPLVVFPDLRGPQQDGSVENAEKLTSIIPRQSDETLVKFLGEAAIDNFLSLWLEWRDPLTSDEEEIGGAASGVVGGEPTLDLARFRVAHTHQSWVEAVEKERSMKGIKGVTLDQCFETFTKPERLDERNMWYCSNCKEHVRAMKTMQLWRLPNVLIVHLKRFEFKNVLRRDKLDTFVDFPLEGLDMSAHCASRDEKSFVDESVPAMYDLFAVTNHFGRMGFGHYTAFARQWNENGISNDWALFDDSTVRSVGDGTDSVVSPAAYVLFYRRRTWN